MPRKTTQEHLQALLATETKRKEAAKKATRRVRAAHQNIISTATKAVGRRASRDDKILRMAQLDDESFEAILKAAEDPKELARLRRWASSDRKEAPVPDPAAPEQKEAAE